MGAERLPFKLSIMKIVLNNIGEKLVYAYLILLSIWLVFALSFQLFGTYIELVNPAKAQIIATKIEHKIDACFSSDTTNIWH